MGRGRIEIKRIENSSNRQVTFSKRRNGMLKKAKEISVLCDARVSVVIFGNSGKMHEFSSSPVVEILDQYHKLTGKRLWDAKHEDLENEINRVKKENDNMQVELRHLKGEDISSLSYRELMYLEDSLQNGQRIISEKQMEVWRSITKRIQGAGEENEHLRYRMRQLEIAEMNRNMGEIGGGGGSGGGGEVFNHHQERDHQGGGGGGDHHQMLPFTFCVQPMQPNLHDHHPSTILHN
ncbi:unnamed protein product [Cuscuta campestris]|uniref:Uncharacterized protein n=1 Tax=Cuscuta campestris TaxID=132261 RepID=A0A484NPM5_9ASTE|nr:unnamed protein product [Cuscuta campestris]